MSWNESVSGHLHLHLQDSYGRLSTPLAINEMGKRPSHKNAGGRSEFEPPNYDGQIDFEVVRKYYTFTAYAKCISDRCNKELLLP